MKDEIHTWYVTVWMIFSHLNLKTVPHVWSFQANMKLVHEIPAATLFIWNGWTCSCPPQKASLERGCLFGNVLRVAGSNGDGRSDAAEGLWGYKQLLSLWRWKRSTSNTIPDKHSLSSSFHAPKNQLNCTGAGTSFCLLRISNLKVLSKETLSFKNICLTCQAPNSERLKYRKHKISCSNTDFLLSQTCTAFGERVNLTYVVF